MADSVAERLAAIRETYQPVADRITERGWTSEDEAWDELGPSGVHEWNASVAARQAVGLLGIVEAVLATKPSMHQGHGPIPEKCRFCAGEAAGLRKVRRTIGIQLLDGGAGQLAAEEDNRADSEPDYVTTYGEFWREIVEVPDGTLNRDQVMRELADYRVLLKEVPLAYDEVTGGRFSKPNTDHGWVVAAVDERIDAYAKDQAREIVEQIGKLDAVSPADSDRPQAWLEGYSEAVSDAVSIARDVAGLEAEGTADADS